jgi:hypothetical protein
VRPYLPASVVQMGEGTRSPAGDPSRHRSKAQRPAVLPRAKKWVEEFTRNTTEILRFLRVSNALI